MEESKMESFHTTQSLSLIILGLGMMASAHATFISCDDEFAINNEIVEVENSIECNTGDAPNGYAIRISGDDIHFLLNDFSISAEEGDEPARGISITGESNHVMGPGTVEGFGGDGGGNVIISSADDNHVSGLALIEGATGVGIINSSNNYVSHNIINNPISFGIDVLAITGSAQLNHIYNNSIKNSGAQGIRVVTSLPSGSADANHIYDNSIQMTEDVGILISGNAGSANANQVHNNNIEDTGTSAILISVSSGTSNQNQLLLNHIFRPGEQAIKLENSGDGSIAHNVITYNYTQHPQVTPVYCDDTDQVNHWQINFIDLQQVNGNPGPC